MKPRTRVVLWIAGIIVLFGTIVLIWAIDTDRISIFADENVPIIESAEELQKLPSPDQSTFSKIYTAIANLFN